MKSAIRIMARVSAGLAIALSAPCAWALSVMPPRTEVHLSPGTETTILIHLENPDPAPYDVELSEKPWFIYPDNRAIQVDQWLKLPSKKKFRLKKGKKKDIKISVMCPKEAVGELMGMVSFTYQGTAPSMVTPMISVAVYVEVTGTEKNAGEISNLSAGTRDHHFQVGAQVKATGNIRLRPTGYIQLLSEQGQVVSHFTIPEANPIFPGAMRACVGQGPDTPPPAGRYTLEAVIQSGTLELKSQQIILVNAKGDVELEKKEAAKS